VALEDAKYMLLTTFRSDGTPVATPVWVVKLDGGRLGCWTSSESGKAKRLAHTAHVTVTSCDARGRVKAGAEVVDATARLVTGDALEEIRKQVIVKYGAMAKFSKLMVGAAGVLRGKRRPYADRGVVITPTSIA